MSRITANQPASSSQEQAETGSPARQQAGDPAGAGSGWDAWQQFLADVPMAELVVLACSAVVGLSGLRAGAALGKRAVRLGGLLLVALLSSACECDCVTGPTAQPAPSCSIPVLTVELSGRTVVGSWAASDVRLSIDEEVGSPGNYGPLEKPGNLSLAADGFRWTAAKDGRYRFTARTGCGQSVRVVLIDTAPVPEPPDPPKQPEGPMPCVAGMRPNPGC